MRKFLLTMMVIALSFSTLSAGTTAPDSVVVMDEVAIVATPKESNAMRRLPQSVTQLSSNQLASHHVASLKGVSNLVPNLFMPDYGSRLTSAIYIRGIGSRINTPAVGLYVDNMPYVDKSSFDFHLTDIERVDIMRGPQATLYGRNAMGGIVKVYTRNPFNYQGTDLRLGYASGDNHRTASLAHYHRPSDKLAFTVGGYYESGDGFFRNSLTGKKVDAMSSGGGKVRTIWKPRQQLTFDFNANYDYTDEGAYPYFYTGTLAGTEQFGSSVDKITNNRESSYRRSMVNAGLNAEYKHSKFTLNAITGYQNLRDRMFMDQDFLSADIYTLEQRQLIHTLTEEVIVKNANPDTRWQWLNGVSFMYQTLNTVSPVNFHSDGMDFLETNINSKFDGVVPAPMKMYIGLNDSQLTMGGSFDTPTLNIALFHQSTVKICEGFFATAGLRLDYDRLRMDYHSAATMDYTFRMLSTINGATLYEFPNLVAPLLYDGTLRNNYLRLLPKFSLNYEFNKQNSVYASVAMGQRSGGYNLQMFSELLQGAMRKGMIDGVKAEMAKDDYLQVIIPKIPNYENPTTDQVTYKPEYNWNYEVGTHLGTADGRLQADASVFYMQTHNQQIARFADSGLGRRMVNAGRSESYGLELSGRWRPIDALLLSANYGYTHATFTRYSEGSKTEGDTPIDYTGNYVPFVPRHNVTADASYAFSFQNCKVLRRLTLGANYSGTGRIYWTESNLTADGRDCAYQRFYSLLGAYVTLTNEHITLNLWGRNLTNTKYNTFYFESASRGFEQHGKPWQLGVDVKVNF